jgi:hypothetical protein
LNAALQSPSSSFPSWQADELERPDVEVQVVDRHLAAEEDQEKTSTSAWREWMSMKSGSG